MNEKQSQLYNAVRDLDIERVERLLTIEKTDPNFIREGSGFPTVLHLASKAGYFDLLKLLLDNGATPLVNSTGGKYSATCSTPLDYVCQEKIKKLEEFLNCAKILLALGANPNKIMRYPIGGGSDSFRLVFDDQYVVTEYTALHTAVSAGNVELVRLLLESDASIDIPKIQTNTHRETGEVKVLSESVFDIANRMANQEMLALLSSHHAAAAKTRQLNR